MASQNRKGQTEQFSRLYRVWLSYRTSPLEPGRKEIKCEVIAKEAARAIQAVLEKYAGIDVIVATIEQVSELEKALKADDDGDSS